MTKAEYDAAYRASRATFDSLSTATLGRIRRVYIDAAADVAAKVASAELAGQSVLTTDSLAAIEAELRRGADIITEAMRQETPELVNSVYKSIYQIDEEYILSALGDANVTRVSAGQIAAYGVSVNHSVIQSMVNRIWQDGYSFSERTTFPGSLYQDAIKDVLAGGLSQGRDPVKIAKDITEYVRKGSGAVEGRWGKLKPGTREYYRRLPKNVDYRALRIVRSELYASLQDAGRLEGQLNPAATGMYNWILEPNDRPPGDPCPDIADQSPYALEELPDYPHPNSYAEGTEVYTRRGWIEFPSVDIDTDEFLSLNPDTLNYEWVKAAAYVEYPYHGDMIDMKSNSFHLVTTPEHQHYGKNSHAKHQWFNSAEVHAGKKSYYAIPRHGDWIGDTPDTIILAGQYIDPALYCEFMGYYLSEGCVPRRDGEVGYCVSISQFKEDAKRRMWSAVSRLPFKSHIVARGISIYDRGLAEELACIGHKCWNFEIPEVMMTLSSELITVFLNAFMLGDGSQRDTNGMAINSRERVLFTSSDRMAAQLGELIIKAGGYPSYYMDDAKTVEHRNGTYTTKHPCWRISWNRKKYSYKRNSPCENGKGIVSSLVRYGGNVYDVTLEKNHILWVRYDGKTCFSGNCACHVYPVLRDRAEFISDLKRWSDGEPVDYLDSWESRVLTA